MKSILSAVPVFLVVWLVLGWTFAYGQNALPELAPQIGTELEPRGPLDAWERYPSGLLRGKGNRIGTIRPGTTYTVTGTKVIEVLLFGDQHYLQVELAGVESGQNPRVWVFQGREGVNLPPNLVPPGCEPIASTPTGFECEQKQKMEDKR